MIITEISACKKIKDRYNVYVDGEFACALFLDTILDYGLRKGKEVDREELKQIAYEDGCKKCFMKGCYLLSIRQRGERELRQKLAEKGFEKQQVDRAVEMLKARGYIDDRAYAFEYAEYLQKKRLWCFCLKAEAVTKGH